MIKMLAILMLSINILALLKNKKTINCYQDLIITVI